MNILTLDDVIIKADPFYIRIYHFIRYTHNYFKFFYYLKFIVYLYAGLIKNNSSSNDNTILYISMITGGGLQKHLFELAHGISDNYNVWILSEDSWIYNISNNKIKKFNYNIYKYSYNYNYKCKYRYSLNDIITLINPDIIHVHQFSKNLDEVSDLDLSKCVITLHDLFMVCPHFFMVECFDKFCHPSLCSKEWRQKCKHILMNCKYIICPSSAIESLITFYYPDEEIKNKIMVIEHGIDINV